MKTENFFVMTNPLFWVWCVIILIYHTFDRVINFMGVKDWWYVLFKLKDSENSTKEFILEESKIKMLRMFWLKRKAWDYAAKKIRVGHK